LPLPVGPVNQPVDGADGAALIEDVAAEPREPLDAEREVELQHFFEPLLLRVREHAVHELLRLGRLQLRQRQALQVAVDANLRRRARRNVQIRSVHLDERLQQFR